MVVVHVVVTASTFVLFFVTARAAATRYRLVLIPDRLLLACGVAAVFCATAARCADVGVDAFLAAAAVCAWTDLRTGFIFDRVVAAAFGLVALWGAVDHRLAACLVGALAAGGVIGLLFLASRGRGIGLGDAKLAALLGAQLGAVAGVASVGSAFVAGAGFVVMMALVGRLPGDGRLAFGPFLALSGAVLSVARAWGLAA